MTRLRLTLEIAAWEFRRFFKLKEQLIMLLLFVLASGGYYGFARWQKQSHSKPVRVAVLGAPAKSLTPPPGSRLRLEERPGATEASLRDAVGRKELDGLLIVGAADSAAARLVTRRDPVWRAEVEEMLLEKRRAETLRSLGLSAEVMDRLTARPRLEIELHERTAATGSRASRLVAVLFLVFTIGGLYLGNAYLFIGITGEKQQRVTEQVLSAVRPQTWIDGKILGLAGVALASLVAVVIGMGLFAVAPVGLDLILQGTPSPPSPEDVARAGTFLDRLGTLDPGFVLFAFAFAFLGFLFWFALFAAIAATINDPHTSQRGIFLFLPMLSPVLGFAVLGDPDGALARVLSLLPVTAHAVLPARMTMTDVAWWEPAVAVALTILSIHLLRIAAGRIFALGMLLYGKEPSLREMWRWVRET